MNNRKSRRLNFIIQGSILAVTSIIVRIIGLLYRLPLTNIIGDEGNGYYSAAFEVYSIFLLISSYSLPLAVSKLVSVRVSGKQYKNAYRIFKGALLFALISGGTAALIVFFGADFIASQIMTEPLSAIALRVLAPALLILAIMGVIRGYFQGLSTMMPTAVSQLIEQIVNAGISITAALYLFSYGKKIGNIILNPSYAPAYGAAGSTLGTMAGALFGLLFLIFVFLAYKSVFKKQLREDNLYGKESYRTIVKILILTIVPVLLSTLVYNVSTILDQAIFNKIMTAKGLGDVKTSLWGVYSGKYRILINVPIALASAMASSIIPGLAGAIQNREFKSAKRKVTVAIRFTMIISIPCAVGLAVLGRSIIDMLFTGDPKLASRMLLVGSVSVVFYSLSTLTNGVLQGINRMRIPIINALLSLVIHLAALYVMLVTFNLGIFAVVYANIIFSLCMCLLNGVAIRKHLRYKQELVKTFVIPGFASLVMGVFVYFINMGLGKVTNQAVSVLLSIILGAVVYGIVLLALKGISEDEINSLPKGKTIARILKKLHLIN